jgi:hypothetical protein
MVRRGTTQEAVLSRPLIGAHRAAILTRLLRPLKPNIRLSRQQVWDRKPLYCTAVPGEAAWVAGLNPGEQDCAAIRPSTPPPEEPGTLVDWLFCSSVAFKISRVSAVHFNLSQPSLHRQRGARHVRFSSGTGRDFVTS